MLPEVSLTDLRITRDAIIHNLRLQKLDEAIQWIQDIVSPRISSDHVTPLIDVLTKIKTHPFEEWKNMVKQAESQFWRSVLIVYCPGIHMDACNESCLGSGYLIPKMHRRFQSLLDPSDPDIIQSYMAYCIMKSEST